MHLAVVSSAHGYGHATRDVALADALVRRGHRCTLITAAPAAVVGGAHARVERHVDVGLAQPDSVSEDVAATRARLDERCGERAVDALAAELGAYDAVVVDIAPAALEAARRAGKPAVAVGNFDWAWVYRHYAGLEAWAERFAAWQAPHPAVQLRPGPDLTGFASVVEGGLVARRFAPVRVSPPGVRAVLVGFGGFGLAGVDALLPELPGVEWLLAPPMVAPPRADCRFVADVPFSALLAGADAVLTKPGYGMVAEATLAGVPLVWLDRGRFPEAPYLEAAMRARGDRKVDAPADAPAATRRAALAAALHAVLAGPLPPRGGRDDSATIAVQLTAAVGCG